MVTEIREQAVSRRVLIDKVYSVCLIALDYTLHEFTVCKFYINFIKAFVRKV